MEATESVEGTCASISEEGYIPVATPFEGGGCKIDGNDELSRFCSPATISTSSIRLVKVGGGGKLVGTNEVEEAVGGFKVETKEAGGAFFGIEMVFELIDMGEGFTVEDTRVDEAEFLVG